MTAKVPNNFYSSIEVILIMFKYDFLSNKRAHYRQSDLSMVSSSNEHDF